MKPSIFSCFPFFLFLLPSLVQAQNSTCYSSFCQNSKTCEEVEEQCPGYSECMTLSQEFEARGVKYVSFAKRCALNLPCNISVHGKSINGLHLRTIINCCQGNRCNTDEYNIPKKDPQEKGMLCPACLEYDTLDGCDATKSTVCWEKDDLCAKFKGTIEGPDGVPFNLSAQGCISATACKYDFSEVPYLKLLSYKENECYTPNSPEPEKKPEQ